MNNQHALSSSECPQCHTPTQELSYQGSRYRNVSYWLASVHLLHSTSTRQILDLVFELVALSKEASIEENPKLTPMVPDRDVRMAVVYIASVDVADQRILRLLRTWLKLTLAVCDQLDFFKEPQVDAGFFIRGCPET